jgi:NAD(P)-dependent dehydrogenase (short-subunit alcohol dehydrogenase family)
MGRVDGKAAIVTGGSLGIGRACAKLLAREGAMVAVTDVLEDEGKQLVAEIKAECGLARFWNMNVADEREVKAVFADVAKSFGKIDILVNNAGISGANKPTDQLTEEEWDKVQAVNVKGVFFCTKHAVPFMRKAGGGSIINLSSI